MQFIVTTHLVHLTPQIDSIYINSIELSEGGLFLYSYVTPKNKNKKHQTE